jgi:hypothetical protein
MEFIRNNIWRLKTIPDPTLFAKMLSHQIQLLIQQLFTRIKGISLLKVSRSTSLQSYQQERYLFAYHILQPCQDH